MLTTSQISFSAPRLMQSFQLLTRTHLPAISKSTQLHHRLPSAAALHLVTSIRALSASAEALPASNCDRHQSDSQESRKHTHQVQHTTDSPSVTTSEMQAAAAGGYSTGVTTVPSGQGFKRTFYKRTLPSPPSIAFASTEGRQIFSEALVSGHMTGFFKLMEQFSTQDEPSFCGLASLAMVLNALAIDPRRTWKGAWRWFHEQMLDCCRPLEDVKREGITLPQAACLARCNGARVTLNHYGKFTLEDLRQQVIEVCSSGKEHLIVSYSRRAFLQTGDGHFSPVGGYHKEKDLVLILDVARFKYPPHWVPLPLLYDAMKYVDSVTDQPRGFLRVSAQPLLSSVLLTLDVRSNVWQAANEWLRRTVPSAMQAAAQDNGPSDIEALLCKLLSSLPLHSLDAFLAIRHNSLPTTSPEGAGSPRSEAGSPAGTCGLCSSTWSMSASMHACETTERCLPIAATQLLLTEIRALPLYQMVDKLMKESGQLGLCTTLTCSVHVPSQEEAQPSTKHAQHEQHDHAENDHTQPVQSMIQQHSQDISHQGATQHTPDSATHHDHSQVPVHHHHHQHEHHHHELDDSEQPAALPGHGNSGYLAEKATMLLLMLKGTSPWPSEWSNEAIGQAWNALMDSSNMSVVEAELTFLREQWAHIDEVVHSNSLEPKCNTGCQAKLDCVVLRC